MTHQLQQQAKPQQQQQQPPPQPQPLQQQQRQPQQQQQLQIQPLQQQAIQQTIANLNALDNSCESDTLISEFGVMGIYLQYCIISPINSKNTSHYDKTWPWQPHNN